MFIFIRKVTWKISLIFRSNLLTLRKVGLKESMHSQTCPKIYWRNNEIWKYIRGFRIYRSFATRVSQLKIWHFWVIGIGRNVCRCTFNRYSVITQFAKLAAGEQLCRRWTLRKLWHFKTFKHFSWKFTNIELCHRCRKLAIYWRMYSLWVVLKLL